MDADRLVESQNRPPFLPIETPPATPGPEASHEGATDYQALVEAVLGPDFNQTPARFRFENLDPEWREASVGFDRHNRLPYYNDDTRALLGVEMARCMARGGHFLEAEFDVNRLKKANEEFGHDSLGDLLIAEETAAVLKVFDALNLSSDTRVFAVRPSQAADEVRLLFYYLNDNDDDLIRKGVEKANLRKIKMNLPDKFGNPRDFEFSSTGGCLGSKDLEQPEVKRSQRAAKVEYDGAKEYIAMLSESGDTEAATLRKIISVIFDAIEVEVVRKKEEGQEEIFPVSEDEIKKGDLSLTELRERIKTVYGGTRPPDSVWDRALNAAYQLGSREQREISKPTP